MFANRSSEKIPIGWAFGERPYRLHHVVDLPITGEGSRESWAGRSEHTSVLTVAFRVYDGKDFGLSLSRPAPTGYKDACIWFHWKRKDSHTLVHPNYGQAGQTWMNFVNDKIADAQKNADIKTLLEEVRCEDDGYRARLGSLKLCPEPDDQERNVYSYHTKFSRFTRPPRCLLIAIPTTPIERKAQIPIAGYRIPGTSRRAYVCKFGYKGWRDMTIVQCTDEGLELKSHYDLFLEVKASSDPDGVRQAFKRICLGEAVDRVIERLRALHLRESEFERWELYLRAHQWAFIQEDLNYPSGGSGGRWTALYCLYHGVSNPRVDDVFTFREQLDPGWTRSRNSTDSAGSSI